MRRRSLPATALAAAFAALLAALAPAPAAFASRTQASLFQDDDLLVHADDATVVRTLDELELLGVDVLRITLVWRSVAPAAGSQTRPTGFDAADPDAYPDGAWAPWDRVLRLAGERGLDVLLNVTAPAPSWATGSPERADIEPTYAPDATEFGLFVRAAATRYDGSHGHPRVERWSIQNEPNHPGWLTPQWLRAGDGWVEAAPRVYRAMVDAAWTALQETGHGGDTILIGETAPKGLRMHRGETRGIDTLRFIRRLYCLDDNLQVLAGADAEALGCPTSDPVASFRAAHPGLFGATGWAHHPYELLLAPDRAPAWDDWATMGNLGDLRRLLRRVHARYGHDTGDDVPLYLTEFGYQTDPPDRLGVSRSEQAAYLNHAEYIAWRDDAVRMFAQFLLRDDGPPVEQTFQSGLRTEDGRRKGAWAAYRFPVHVPQRRVRAGLRLRVWGIPRPAAEGSRPRVRIEYRFAGTKRWRLLATRRGDRVRGYVSAGVRAPRRSGRLRLRWGRITSRSVPIRVVTRRAR